MDLEMVPVYVLRSTFGKRNNTCCQLLITSAETQRKSNTNTSIPAWRALISGAVAGLTVDIILYPIDTIKTRLQSPNGLWKSGGFKGIHKGLSAAAAGSAPTAALFFLTYECSKPWIQRNILNDKSSIDDNPLTHMISASIAETVACAARVPTEVVKQRMQTGRYGKLSIALKEISSMYGIRGFYVGYGSTVAREVPFSFIQFPLWERAKLQWKKHINDGNEIAAYQGAICGSLSGGIAAAITTPLDVIKTRLMLDVDGISMGTCAKRLYAENGMKTFFNGIVPRVSWITIGGFLFFGSYEKMKQLTGI